MIIIAAIRFSLRRKSGVAGQKLKKKKGDAFFRALRKKTGAGDSPVEREERREKRETTETVVETPRSRRLPPRVSESARDSPKSPFSHSLCLSSSFSPSKGKQ